MIPYLVYYQLVILVLRQLGRQRTSLATTTRQAGGKADADEIHGESRSLRLLYR